MRSKVAVAVALIIAASAANASDELTQQTSLATQSRAAEGEIDFNILPQTLSQALVKFAEQSALVVTASSDVLEGKSAPAISGKMRPEEALQRLLQGTGLKFIKGQGGDLTILKDATASRAMAAGTIRLAQADGSTRDVAGSAAATEISGEGSSANPARSGASSDAQVQALEEVTVTGSQIRGANTRGAVPVTVLGEDQLKEAGALSGEDIFRSLPQAGDVAFNTTWLGGQNQGAARGDVSSINLRGLGVGNTLVLLNGRRIVIHPASQNTQEVTYNANALPVAMLECLEVLSDGAAALYGSDAVAGVVNNVLRRNFDGLTVESQYGLAEGTSLEQFDGTVHMGHNFAGGNGNISTSLSANRSTALLAGDQSFTASADRRGLVEGTSFAGNVGFDARSTATPWGVFATPVGFGAVRANGAPITSAAGQFHIQPSTNAGCLYELGGGICIDDGAITTAADRNLRFNSNATFPRIAITPQITRVNSFTTASYELDNGLEFFGELGYYWSETEGLGGPAGPLAPTVITVPASAYYNPFGPIGSPNRIAGLDNVPAEGLPLRISTYTPADVGLRASKVQGEQYRVLGGLRGSHWDWDWESAVVYSEAEVNDTLEGISHTLFQQALARTTPDAYNPFSGGDPANPSIGDSTRSLDLSSFKVKGTRSSSASLALWDFKVSRADLFQLPSGPLGVAAGVELRRETSRDDRNNYADGKHPYTDLVTGISYASDFMGTSAAPDIANDRVVKSAYLELAVPIVSPDMNIPLVDAFNVQLAGRYESYDDVGDVAKPKIAAYWDVVPAVRLRASWSESFKAPTLEQLVPAQRIASGTLLDVARCEADLRAGRIANFGACIQLPQTPLYFSGSPDLKPEESDSFSFGAVFRALFLPAQWGSLTLTLDHWKVNQTNRVAAVPVENALALDYLLRVQGSSNPDVLRAEPTADDVAFVAGTGLAPIGQIQGILFNYGNLDVRTIKGVDATLAYTLPSTPLGDFNLNINVARTLEYFQLPSAIQRQLLQGRDAGLINSAVAISGAADLLQDAGQPKWKWNASLGWRYDVWSAGVSAQYVGEVFQNTVTNGVGDIWTVDSLLTANLYVERTFLSGGSDAQTKVRLGARNVTNEDPPLAAGSGYLGNLYQPYARYWYVNLKKSF